LLKAKSRLKTAALPAFFFSSLGLPPLYPSPFFLFFSFLILPGVVGRDALFCLFTYLFSFYPFFFFFFWAIHYRCIRQPTPWCLNVAVTFSFSSSFSVQFADPPSLSSLSPLLFAPSGWLQFAHSFFSFFFPPFPPPPPPPPPLFFLLNATRAIPRWKKGQLVFIFPAFPLSPLFPFPPPPFFFPLLNCLDRSGLIVLSLCSSSAPPPPFFFFFSSREKGAQVF